MKMFNAGDKVIVLKNCNSGFYNIGSIGSVIHNTNDSNYWVQFTTKVVGNGRWCVPGDHLSLLNDNWKYANGKPLEHVIEDTGDPVCPMISRSEYDTWCHDTEGKLVGTDRNRDKGYALVKSVDEDYLQDGDIVMVWDVSPKTASRRVFSHFDGERVFVYSLEDKNSTSLYANVLLVDNWDRKYL